MYEGARIIVLLQPLPLTANQRGGTAPLHGQSRSGTLCVCVCVCVFVWGCVNVCVCVCVWVYTSECVSAEKEKEERIEEGTLSMDGKICATCLFLSCPCPRLAAVLCRGHTWGNYWVPRQSDAAKYAILEYEVTARVENFHTYSRAFFQTSFHILSPSSCLVGDCSHKMDESCVRVLREVWLTEKRHYITLRSSEWKMIPGVLFIVCLSPPSPKTCYCRPLDEKRIECAQKLSREIRSHNHIEPYSILVI